MPLSLLLGRSWPEGRAPAPQSPEHGRLKTRAYGSRPCTAAHPKPTPRARAQLAIFSFAAWAGADHGGVVAGLVAGDLIGGIAGTPAALLGDWKTAHLTRTSVLAMLLTNLVGGVIGCLPGPLIFQIFWKAFPIGDPAGCARRPSRGFPRAAHRPDPLDGVCGRRPHGARAAAQGRGLPWPLIIQGFWKGHPGPRPLGVRARPSAPRGRRQGSQTVAAAVWV